MANPWIIYLVPVPHFRIWGYFDLLDLHLGVSGWTLMWEINVAFHMQNRVGFEGYVWACTLTIPFIIGNKGSFYIVSYSWGYTYRLITTTKQYYCCCLRFPLKKRFTCQRTWSWYLHVSWNLQLILLESTDCSLVLLGYFWVSPLIGYIGSGKLFKSDP